jgi:hypothetical protein
MSAAVNGMARPTNGGVFPCRVWPAAHPLLAHSAVPLELAADDLRQVQQGGYVVKVVYLPAQGPGGLGVISAGVGPGADPVQEAQRRGSVLPVLRIGNIDLEAP